MPRERQNALHASRWARDDLEGKWLECRNACDGYFEIGREMGRTMTAVTVGLGLTTKVAAHTLRLLEESAGMEVEVEGRRGKLSLC